jgi:hypothetical protein
MRYLGDEMLSFLYFYKILKNFLVAILGLSIIIFLKSSRTILGLFMFTCHVCLYYGCAINLIISK